MSTVQIISETPEQLKNAINEGVKRHLEASFQTKLQNAIIEGVKLHLDDLKASFQSKEQNTYLTRSDVANMLKIDISSVHNWTRKGILKSYQISGRVYYKLAEVEGAIVELKK